MNYLEVSAHNNRLLSNLFDTVYNTITNSKYILGPNSIDREKVLDVVNSAIRKVELEALDALRFVKSKDIDLFRDEEETSSEE